MTDRQHRWLLFALIWGFAILVLVAAAVLISPQAAHGQGPCCPPSQCGPTVGAGVFGPSGGWVGARAGGGRGIQAGVGGPYGGVVGAQVGPGPRVQAGVIPPSQPPAQPPIGIAWRPDCMVMLRSSNSLWSGVLVSIQNGMGIVATSSHSFPDSEVPRTTAMFPGGRRFLCRLLARDDEADCVLLGIGQPPVPPIAMRPNPKAGTVLRVCGFGGGRPGVDTARVTGEAAPGGTNRWEWFSFSPENAAEPGDSGGPILDGQGYLVGIVSGTGTGVGSSVIQGLLAGTSNVGSQSNGGLPGDVAGQEQPAADYLPPRPVVTVSQFNEVKVTVETHSGDIDKLTAYVQGQTKLNEEIQQRLATHGDALADHDERLANHEGRITALEDLPAVEPVDLAGIEARLAALEAGLQRPIGFVDRYMRLDPNGDVEYMGRRYSLRDEKHETIALGESRVTYYYPLEQGVGNVAPANP